MRSGRGKPPRALAKQDRPAGRARASTRRRWPIACAAILGATFAIYLPSLDNAFINWDDNYYVTENRLLERPTLREILTVPVAANYHPLTVASLVLNHRISGLDPTSYHWLNLLLHVANTALVFLFVRRLTHDRFWTTLVTSLFFGIHPMHVESVAWIAERKDVLYAFFYLIALIGYVGYLDSRRTPWLLGTLLAFALSAASKPAAVVLPVTLLAIDWFRRRPLGAGLLLEKIPFFALSIAAGIVTLHVQRSAGAIADPHLWSPVQKLLFASHALVMYVVKMFLPLQLSAIYPYPSITARTLPAEFYVSLLALVLALSAILIFGRRNRTMLFGLGFFLINIILVLQLLTVGGAVMADRYTYLPYVGLFFALAWRLDEPAGSGSRRALGDRLTWGVLLVLLPLSLIQTWRRCDVWQDSETLWNDTIRRYPGRIVDAYYNRAEHRRRAGRLEEAVTDYDQALALNSGVVRIWYNKGLALAALSRSDSARVCFERVLGLDPKFVDAWNNRGTMKLQLGDRGGAVADYSQAVALNPRFRDGYANRALAYFEMGRWEESIADSRRAIAIDPQHPENDREFGAIGEALLRLNRPREAIAEFDRAIGSARSAGGRLGGYHLYRSAAWWALRDRARARDDAREAMRRGVTLDPSYLRQLGI